MSEPSPLEKRFLFLWDKVIKGPKLEPEYRFCSTRKWRFDFAHPKTMVAIEIEGGLYRKGRHTTLSGFTADCEKYNYATLLGWRIFRLPSSMILSTELKAIEEFINPPSVNTFQDNSHSISVARQQNYGQ